MHLLNVRTKSPKTFVDRIPPYAILSHTWRENELTYHEVVSENSPRDAWGPENTPRNAWGRSKNFKVNSACRQALKDGYDWIWIDTCCIDKTSSAELTEAINSMFRWYQDAAVCYAFLEDAESLAGSPRWFTRGWTLQELIAPRVVKFYNKDWRLLGDKAQLADGLSKRTDIPTNVLTDISNLWSTSIACRMSWASQRETTRIEDKAYCLLGIFGVNMPLLYGEGERAFLRLQEEIIKISDDQSIFVWNAPSADQHWRGALAQSPAGFADSAKMVPIPKDTEHVPYYMTNTGLSITLPMFPSAAYYKDHKIYVGFLQCQIEDDFSGQMNMSMYETDEEGVFVRCPYRDNYCGKTVREAIATCKMRSIYIENPSRALYNRPTEVICILQPMSAKYSIAIAKAQGVDCTWNAGASVLRLRRTPASFARDMAAAFMFMVSPLNDTDLPEAFMVVLYFPHQSSNTRKIGGVMVFDRPADWNADDWFIKARQDLHSIYIQGSVAEQSTTSTASCKCGRNRTDASSASVVKRRTVEAELEEVEKLGQCIFELTVSIGADDDD